MNAESNHIQRKLATELASFDDQLDGNSGNAKLVASIRAGIGRLLELSGGNDAGIRRVLQEQYAGGSLRSETFQLVESILDRYMSEQIPTEPTAATTARELDTPSIPLPGAPSSLSLDYDIPPLNPPGAPAAAPGDAYAATAVIDRADSPVEPTVRPQILPPVTADEVFGETQLIDEMDAPAEPTFSPQGEAPAIADEVYTSTKLIDETDAPAEPTFSPQAEEPDTADEVYTSTKVIDETDAPVAPTVSPHFATPIAEDDGYTSTTVINETESPLDPNIRPGEMAPPSADDLYASTAVIDKTEIPPAAAAERAQVGSVLRDRFLLQKRVTGGSMGVVYKALDRRLAEVGETEHWVAIKVLSPTLARNGNALRALQQEAAKGRHLSHPNIVRFIDFDRDDDLYFLVMEWLDGKSLAEILDTPETKKFDVEKALEIVRQVGKALEYAHRCGIVHADVKPGNIMIMPDGVAKLFDFGIARVWQKAESGDAGFDPGVLGAVTPAYSSMQVITGEMPVPTDDVFSLACLFYRLVAGYRVFGPRNAAEACEAGMEPQPLQGLSKSQWQAVRKALSFSRVTRYESVVEFLEALDTAPAPAHEIEIDPGSNLYSSEPTDFGKWLIGIVALGLIGSFVAVELGYLSRWLPGTGILDSVVEAFDSSVADAPDEADAADSPGADPERVEENIETLPPEPAAVAPRKFDGSGETPVTNEAASSPETVSAVPADTAVHTETPPASAATAAEPVAAVPEPAAEPGPPATPADVEIPLNRSGIDRAVRVRLRENADPVTVDLLRLGSLDSSLRVRLEEVDYSGNRSPLRTRQYSVAGGRTVEFRRGSERARLELVMSPDPLREADQQSTLKIRAIDGDASALAYIRIELEDDDQRAFATDLAPDTVGFAVSQMSVSEQDPAVQIDVVRYNPGDEPLVVEYAVSSITATEGDDYFSPGVYSILFAPGQRSARLLIPLVQDARYEGDEAFVVEIVGGPSGVPDEVYQRIAVMIRDDDPAPANQGNSGSP